MKRHIIALTLLAATAQAAQQQPSRRVVVMGDSILAGTGLSHVTKQATYELQRQSGLVIQTFASPGATMADNSGLPGMQHATQAIDLLYGFFGFYALAIDLGTNDWGAGSITPEAFSSAYAAFLDSLPPQARVACIGFTWRIGWEGVPNAYGETRDDYRDRIQAVCTARGLPYLDGRQAIPYVASYFADGLHPNDRGNRALGSFLARQFRLLGWSK